MPSLDHELLGKFGFARIDSGVKAPSSGGFARIMAINGDVTFGDQCVSRHGDDLQSGDVLPKGKTIHATFEQIDVQSGGGTLLAIYEAEQ
jgi:hypothetical protein